MKRFISILLVLLLCVSVFVACDDILGNNNDGGSENGGSGSGNGESGGGSGSGSGSGNGGTESGSGSGSGSGNGGTESGSGSGSGSGNGGTESGSGSGSGSGNGGTENGSGNGNTGNGGNENTTKGEAITQAQWDAMRTNSPTNYSYVRKMIRNGEEMEETFLMDGDEYLRILKTKGGEEKLCCIIEDGRTVNYEFDYSKGAWVRANHSIDSPYPLYNFPYEFSQLVFDEETGSYSLTVTNGAESATMTFRFKDGNCVYFGYTGFEVELYNYGTTIVPRPDPISSEGGNGIISGTDDGSGKK